METKDKGELYFSCFNNITKLNLTNSDVHESAIFGEKLPDKLISLGNGIKMIGADPTFVHCRHTVALLRADRRRAWELFSLIISG